MHQNGGVGSTVGGRGGQPGDAANPGVPLPGRSAGRMAAAHGGHVAVSWSESELGIARDDGGRNVIYHEFAHVLDGYDGVVD